MAETTKQASFGPEPLLVPRRPAGEQRSGVVRGQQAALRAARTEPALDFINAFAPRLEKISPHFRADARPSGGSLFRIYRDTRFSKDKSPYKTNLGIHFRHERAKDAHAPGYYLHIGLGEVFAGGGIWHPGTEVATHIREAIVADPHGWRRGTRTGAFAKRLELHGDALKRVPPWADAEHPFAHDLKRKDFGWARLSEDEVVALASSTSTRDLPRDRASDEVPLRRARRACTSQRMPQRIRTVTEPPLPSTTPICGKFDADVVAVQRQKERGGTPTEPRSS